MKKVISKIYRVSDGIRKVFINTLFWVVVGIIIYSYVSIDRDREKSSNLHIRVGSYIVDQKESGGVLQSLFSTITTDEQVTPLWDIIHTLQLAAKDRSIDRIILDLDNLYGTGFATAEELGRAISDFRESGKEIVVFSSFFNQSKYLIASFADYVVMDPMGEVNFSGLAIRRNYWKEFLDKWKVGVEIFRAGEFKSYVEPYMGSSMSSEVKEQNLTWMNLLWNGLNRSIEENRTFWDDDLYLFNNRRAELLSEYGGDSAYMALDIGLVDELMYRGEFFQQYSSTYHFREYLKANITAPWKDRVAVITLEGVITYGDNSSGSISAVDVIDLLDEAESDEYSSVIIRINSGGGSAYASEMIRRKVEELNNIKPVIISMGDVTASGGYWIATAGREIYANRTTITGSIGVFGMFISLEKTLEEFGIESDGVSTSPYNRPNLLNSSLTDENRAVIQLGVDSTYRQFLQLVSESRDISISDLEPICGGRVWAGEQADNFNLIDELGGFNDVLSSLDGIPVFLNGERSLIPHSLQSLMGLTQFDDPKHIYALYK